MGDDRRTGPGIHAGIPLTAEQTATRLQNLARGRLKGKQKEDLAALAIEVTGMDLDALRKSVSARAWAVATLHCGGYNNTQIAAAIGYASHDVVNRTLKERPDVKRIIDLIRQAQVEKILNGEFGVQAQAKAAAPKVMKRIIEKAGGIEDANGDPRGMAHRDADAIRAGETALRVAGELVEKRENVHVHWMSNMSREELTRFADEGVWPERYRHLDGAPRPALDVTPGR